MEALESFGFQSFAEWAEAHGLELVGVSRSGTAVMGLAEVHQTSNLTPPGRLGLQVAWSVPLPNGRHHEAGIELLVAVDPAITEEEQEDVLGLLRDRIDAEVLASLAGLQELPVEEVRSIRHLTEGTYYDELKEDLEGAQTSVVMTAPFVGKRVIELSPILEAASKRGVEVTLLVKPETDSDDPLKGWAGREHWPRLREAGVNVEHRTDQMHEKIVVIDDNVAYHGSLNPISHKNTSESVLRLEGPGPARTLRHLYTPGTGQSAASREEVITRPYRGGGIMRAGTRWESRAPGASQPPNGIFDR